MSAGQGANGAGAGEKCAGGGEERVGAGHHAAVAGEHGAKAGEHLAEWRGEDVSIAAVAAELARLNAEHALSGRRHSAARSLNLIVAPADAYAEQAVARRLDSLSGQSHARTVVLQEHGHDRIDTALSVECHICPQTGMALACQDRVTIFADRSRLEHAHSLVNLLLIRGLPVIAWLPGGEAGSADPSLVAVADRVLLDTGLGDPGAGLLRARETAAMAKVHDLAWGRLAAWRARIAAAFNDREWCDRLSEIDELSLDFNGDALTASLLLAGWITARAGWRLDSLAPGSGGDGWSGDAHHEDGRRIRVALNSEPEAGGPQTGGGPDLSEPGSGEGGDAADRLGFDNGQTSTSGSARSSDPAGVGVVRFAVGRRSLEIGRDVVTRRSSDILYVALHPIDDFTRGYPETLAALTPVLEFKRSSSGD